MSQASFQASESPLDSTGDYDSGTATFTYSDESSLNSKITVAAIIVLILALSIIFSLHFLTRWMHRRIHGNTYQYQVRGRGFATTLESLEAQRGAGGGPNQGLDKASIECLPTFAYKRIMKISDGPHDPEKHDDDDDAMAGLLECSVCLSEFRENEVLKLLPACKHTFHTECIDMWFFSHSTCPLCRTLVSAVPTTTMMKPCPEPPTEVSGSHHHANGHRHVMAAASSSSPAPLEERSAEMESLAREPNTSTSHHNIHIFPASLSHGNSVPYPSNVLFWGNDNQSSASQPSSSRDMIKPPISGSGSRSGKRDVRPAITIQIPSRHDQACACSSPAMAPGDLQSCSSSQPQSTRSPSIRSSIKRMLSRQSSRARVSQPDASSDNLYCSPKDTTLSLHV